MNMLKTEWAKLAQMNFTDKRQYIWEYYKLHIFAIVAITFITGSLLNTMVFNPPRQEYLYFVWLGHPVTSFTLDDFAEELGVIVENPERYVVRASNYNMEGLDPQMIMGLQTRFFAQFQLGGLDLFMLSRDELYGFSSNGFVLPIMRFMDTLEDVNPALHDIMKDRIVEITFYPDESDLPVTDYMAANLRGIPFFDKLYIQTDDLYLAIVINTGRIERIIRALEVILDV